VDAALCVQHGMVRRYSEGMMAAARSQKRRCCSICVVCRRLPGRCASFSRCPSPVFMLKALSKSSHPSCLRLVLLRPSLHATYHVAYSLHCLPRSFSQSRNHLLSRGMIACHVRSLQKFNLPALLRFFPLMPGYRMAGTEVGNATTHR